MKLLKNENIFKTKNDLAIIFIRIFVGGIFILEGTHKLFTPAGVAKFTDIGFSNPEFVSAFASSFEIICGILVLIGFFTRYATIPLIIIMITAIFTTKIPQFDTKPVFDVLHATRLDFALLLSGVFLLLSGGGKYSVDIEKSKNSVKV